MTRHSNRPSKRLVPSLSYDRMCDHRFTKDDTTILEVDCTECSGAQSIDNPKCASGVTNILASGILPEFVVLKRFIHMRYRADRLRHLYEASAALSALRRLETHVQGASDKRCRTCPASEHKLAPDVVRWIRTDPSSFASLREGLSDKVVLRLSEVSCPDLRRCVRHVVWAGSSVYRRL